MASPFATSEEPAAAMSPTPLSSLLLETTEMGMGGMDGNLLNGDIAERWKDVVDNFHSLHFEFFGNGTDTTNNNTEGIMSLRAFCYENKISEFAKLLAESMAEMHNAAQFFDKECEWTRIILTFVFIVVGLLGFVGNLLTVLVIYRAPSLHSHTNYFLASLAVSDLLLILVGVPFDLLSLWPRNTSGTAFFCEVTSTSISWFTFNSILTIVGLTGERLVAICYPFSLRPWFHRNTVIWLIVILWVFSVLPSLYIGLQFKSVVKDFCGHTHRNVYGTCDFAGWTEQSGEDHYTFEAQLIITFVIPVLFIIYCYVRILRTLNEAIGNSHHLNAIPGNASNSLGCSQHQGLLGTVAGDTNPPSPDDQAEQQRGFFRNSHNKQQLNRNALGRNSWRSQQAQKTVVKMLVTITFLFFICYLPFHVERLIVKYTRETCDRSSFCILLYPITGLLQYISATLNPVVYNIMSRRFRREFRRISRVCSKDQLENNGCRCQNGRRNIALQMTPLNRLL